ncbi:Gp19/Gp15/Gp42 family protein [Ruminococcus sp.]|uniref:Gp19/Gp15/Gp42 family protein n=1 Tax=Ruminococcus sp. TaxID=41978 RepID=UPI001B6D7D5A|nr:Gp19/Gp15/Gp42 family protein [Ruminococcus sp.]MBP5432332.1 hypothetical protein [Ruminococcus sp.]
MAGAVYATVSDIEALGISLTTSQEGAADILLSTASSKLRLAARKRGKELDTLIAADADYGAAVKSVIIQAVTRALNSIADSAPAATQGSESNGNYSISMTYLNAGQSLYFLRNELKELGLMRQIFGAIDLYNTGEE